jgi:hypothetical protein
VIVSVEGRRLRSSGPAANGLNRLTSEVKVLVEAEIALLDISLAVIDEARD